MSWIWRLIRNHGLLDEYTHRPSARPLYHFLRRNESVSSNKFDLAFFVTGIPWISVIVLLTLTFTIHDPLISYPLIITVCLLSFVTDTLFGLHYFLCARKLVYHSVERFHNMFSLLFVFNFLQVLIPFHCCLHHQL